MKKILTSVSVAILSVLLCVAFSGCATNVSGNTYQFSEITYDYDGDLSDLEKAYLDLAIESMETLLSGQTITFNEDNTISGSYTDLKGCYWSQSGKTVTVYSDSNQTVELMTLTASGSKLTISETEDGETLNIVFVK